MTLLNKNLTINLKYLNKIIKFNVNDNNCIVESGLTFDALIENIKINLVPYSIPGAINSTIGGCVANNVHGKDFKYGNIGRSVEFIEIITSD